MQLTREDRFAYCPVGQSKSHGGAQSQQGRGLAKCMDVVVEGVQIGL